MLLSLSWEQASAWLFRCLLPFGAISMKAIGVCREHLHRALCSYTSIVQSQLSACSSASPKPPCLPTRMWKRPRERKASCHLVDPCRGWGTHRRRLKGKTPLTLVSLFWGQFAPCFLPQTVYLHAEHANLPWKVNIKAFFLHTTNHLPWTHQPHH